MQFAERQCLPRLFVGRGSNMLFSDTGYAGVVIVNRLRAWTITRTVPTGDRLLSGGVADKHASVAANLASFVAKHGAYVSYVLRADSGCPADYLASVTSQAGLGGLEFAVGIPGTIGGLVAMNAGAHGQEMADVVESVGCVDGRTRRWLHNDSLDWGYRTSCFASDTGLCVTSASIRLRHDSGAADKARDNLARRQASQPCGMRSAGCVFRNPPGSKSAGQLIEECGLKGHRVGGACVSTKHANYLVNADRASAADFDALVRLVQSAVHERCGIVLQPEVVSPTAAGL